MGGRTGRQPSGLPIDADRLAHGRHQGLVFWRQPGHPRPRRRLHRSPVNSSSPSIWPIPASRSALRPGWDPAWSEPTPAPCASIKRRRLPVGQPGQYLTRPGFWAGAIGVAACWHGGTIAVARPLLERSRRRPEPHLLAHLGAVHVDLEQNRAVLAAAARQLDEHFGRDHSCWPARSERTIERNAVEVMDRVGRALGPGPLAHDADHAALVADLTVYIRQHHGERDLEQIGRRLSQLDDPWSR